MTWTVKCQMQLNPAAGRPYQYHQQLASFLTAPMQCERLGTGTRWKENGKLLDFRSVKQSQFFYLLVSDTHPHTHSQLATSFVGAETIKYCVTIWHECPMKVCPNFTTRIEHKNEIAAEDGRRAGEAKHSPRSYKITVAVGQRRMWTRGRRSRGKKCSEHVCKLPQ